MKFCCLRDLGDSVRRFSREGCGMAVRKSFRMEDVLVKTSNPDLPVARMEFNVETEQSVIVLVAATAGVIIAWRLMRAAKDAAKRRAVRRQMRQKLCRHGKTTP